MAILLGKDIVAAYTGISNDDIIEVTINDEAETTGVSARGSAGWEIYATTFLNQTVDIECLKHTLAVGDVVGALLVSNIAVSEPLDGAVTYTISLASA
jgi:predicted secreted protein